MSPARFRVLVADAISLDGLAPLRDDPRFELVNRPGLKGDDLTSAIAEADAVLVRAARWRGTRRDRLGDRTRRVSVEPSTSKRPPSVASPC
jgi:hypothetical protein